MVASAKSDRALSSIYTVSYTHLDVYKRQLLYVPAKSYSLIISSGFHMIRKADPSSGLHFIKFQDVYKRQQMPPPDLHRKFVLPCDWFWSGIWNGHDLTIHS